MLTPEQESTLKLVKVMLGDVGGNPYSPLLSDEEYVTILEQFDWNWRRSVIILGMSIHAMSAGWATRERVSIDLEIETDFAKNYKLYLDNLIKDISSPKSFNITPYASGVGWEDFNSNESNPNNILSALTQLRTCATEELCSPHNPRTRRFNQFTYGGG